MMKFIKLLNNIWGATFIAGIALLIYTLTFHQTLKQDELKIFNGTLRQIPHTVNHGGDMDYNFLLVNLNEFERAFVFRGCAYKKLNMDAIEGVIIGDSISIVVEKNRFINDAFYSVEWNDKNHNPILDYNSYLRCHLAEWKVAIAVIIISIIGFTIKRIKNSLSWPPSRRSMSKQKH